MRQIAFCAVFSACLMSVFTTVAETPGAFFIRRAAAQRGEFSFTPGTEWQKWHSEARASLLKQLGIAEKLIAPRVPLSPQTLWKRKVANGTVFKILLQSEKDYTLPIYLCLPEGKGPFPVWICLQGHGTGMHASLSVAWQDEKRFKYDGGDRDFALQCLQKGVAAICIEQRAFGEKSGSSDRRHSCSKLALSSMMFGETLIGNRVFDIDRAIDFIYSRNELHQDQIGVVGNSGGGTAALYAGAILPRLQRVMPSSCFSTYKDSILALRHCACNYFPGMLKWGDMGDLAGLCAPKKLVIVNGKNDLIFPLHGAQAEFKRAEMIYEAAGAPGNCRLVIGNGGHRFYKADAWPVMEELIARSPAR